MDTCQAQGRKGKGKGKGQRSILGHRTNVRADVGTYVLWNPENRWTYLFHLIDFQDLGSSLTVSLNADILCGCG